MSCSSAAPDDSVVLPGDASGSDVVLETLSERFGFLRLGNSSAAAADAALLECGTCCRKP